MKNTLLFITICLLLQSCKDECWGCLKYDYRSGYFFKETDTIRYDIYNKHDYYLHFKDSLNNLGYSEYLDQIEEELYIVTCNSSDKNRYYLGGYYCSELK